MHTPMYDLRFPAALRQQRIIMGVTTMRESLTMSSTDATPPPPGLTPERVGAFTDAVFAIAMTLLVIEIPRPEGAEFEVGEGVSKFDAVKNLGHFLTAQASSFYACLLAFMLLWLVWRRHHELLDAVDRVSPRVVAWHFPLLLLAAFLPYPTTVIGHYPGNPLAAAFYGLVVGCLLVCRAVLHQMAYDESALRPYVDRGRLQRQIVVAWITTGYWLLSLLLCWWTPWIQILWFLTFVVGFAANAVSRRRHHGEPRKGTTVSSGTDESVVGS
jgi:uncharacterized membrane protein